jgi:hypothetical protein
VAFPVVALLALPEHTAASPQSTPAPAELDAVASPSVSAAVWAKRDRRSVTESTGLSMSVPLCASHAPPVASHDAEPVLVWVAPARTPLAVPPVAAAPVPVPSTSTVASLPPAVPASSPSAWEPLWASQPPAVTVQFADPFDADSGVAEATAAAAAAASVTAAVTAAATVVSVATGVAGVFLWAASLVVAAEPVQASSQSTVASVVTSPASSPRSTALEVPQPVAASQWAVALPVPRLVPLSPEAPPLSPLSSSPLSSPSVLASRITAASSVPDPVLLLSHTPPSVSHPDSDPKRSA